MAGISTIIEGFPHLKIISVQGIWVYRIIAETNLQLNSNAISVHLNQGNGTLGLLALIITPVVYQLLAGAAFVPAVNPGPIFVIIPGATGPQITVFNQAHKIELTVWKEYNAVNKALKQQLLATMDPVF